MKIWRVEKNGKGPFARWELWNSERDYDAFYGLVDLRVHPEPYEDGIPADFPRTFVYGVHEEALLDLWFNEEQRELLARNGFEVSVYESSRFFQGATQVVFFPEKKVSSFPLRGESPENLPEISSLADVDLISLF